MNRLDLMDLVLLLAVLAGLAGAILAVTGAYMSITQLITSRRRDAALWASAIPAGSVTAYAAFILMLSLPPGGHWRFTPRVDRQSF